MIKTGSKKMSITYQTKRELLSRLSQLSNWENGFDINHFIDRLERKTGTSKSPPPIEQEDNNKKLKNLRYFLSFKLDDKTIEGWQEEQYRALSFAKLVLAHEIPLEADLKAFNGISYRKALMFIEGMINSSFELTKAYKEDFEKVLEQNDEYKKHEFIVSFLSDTEKKFTKTLYKTFNDDNIAPSLSRPWYDATEFEGNFTANPFSFSVQKTQDGFNIATSLEAREAIVNCAHIFTESIKGQKAPEIDWTTNSKESILSALEKGREIEDHRKNKWQSGITTLFKDARTLRDTLKTTFGLSQGEFVLIPFKENLAVFAMQQRRLETLQQRTAPNPV